EKKGQGSLLPHLDQEGWLTPGQCDGRNPCGRCMSQAGVACVYEVPTRQSKDEMRREILQLRSRQRQTEEILAALSSHEQSDQILDQLRDGESLEAIRNRLRDSASTSASAHSVTTYSQLSDFQAISHAMESAQNAGNTSLTAPYDASVNSLQSPVPVQQEYPSEPWTGTTTNQRRNKSPHDESMEWTSEPAQQSIVGTWQEHTAGPEFNSSLQDARSRGQGVILGDRNESESPPGVLIASYTRESWTAVTSDTQIVEHLLALYFGWEYPVFASLSKEHFMEDFRRGIPRYCSSLLINALLALGCRFSDHPVSRADPLDVKSTGDHFFAEATMLLESEEDHRSLTTVQAMGIMSIREASCGRMKESLFLSGQSIRLAIEMGLHLEAEVGEEDNGARNEAEEVDDAVCQATFWGAFSLDEAWSLCTANLPHFSSRISLAVKPAILRHVEIASWIPYTDDGGPLEQNCIQPSNIRSVYKTFCELSEIIHLTLYTLYTPGSSVTSKALLDVYGQYIKWYDTIPDALRLGHNFTPSVLFAHLYYHFAILLLFRPFVKFSIVGSDVSPRDNCDQASRAITAIMKSYSELYTLHRTPSFVTYIVLASTTFHLAEVCNNESNTSSRGMLFENMADLIKMSTSHGFAIQAMDAVRYLTSQWGMSGIFGDGAAHHSPTEETLVSIQYLVPIIGDTTSSHDPADIGKDMAKNGFRRLSESDQS
ncbi:Nitrogen assimilation transcription factor nirA, partial [Hyphodiscus hymeniophilus]